MDDSTDNSGGGFDFSGLLNTLQQGVGTVTSTLNAINGTGSPANNNANARAAASSGSTLSQYLPWAIGGVVALLLVSLFLRRK